MDTPQGVELGEHPLAVYDESGDIVGWQVVTVVTPGGIGGQRVSVPGLGLSGALPSAGSTDTRRDRVD